MSNQKQALTPHKNLIHIKAIPPEERTATGIYIPPSAAERPSIGVVTAVGEGRYCFIKGEMIQSSLNIGDVVIFDIMKGYEINHFDQQLISISDDGDAIKAVLPKDNESAIAASSIIKL